MITIMIAAQQEVEKHLLKDLLQHASEVMDPEEAIINYTRWQPLYEQINCAFPVKLIEVISKIEDLPQDRKHQILAIDDSTIALSDSGEVSNIYTKYSHHLNYSVSGLTQNLFS